MVRGLALLLLLVSCDDDPCPRGSMLDSEQGLIVTKAEHPTGWANANCARCHSEAVLHQSACSDEADISEVRDIVQREGYRSCTSCHGDNGVKP